MWEIMLRVDGPTDAVQPIVVERVLKLGEEFAGSEKLGLAPKVLQNLWSSLCERSSAGFLPCKRFCRTLLQNPIGSAEFWGGFGSLGLSFKDWLSSEDQIFTPVPNPGIPY